MSAGADMRVIAVKGSHLDLFPALSLGMFQDRTVQFRDHLGWDVTVDDQGREIDQYDLPETIYVIAERAGKHRASARLRPVTKPCMINEHFAHIAGMFQEDGTWELTRFCTSRANQSGGSAASAVLYAATLLSEYNDVHKVVGVFEEPMLIVYRRLGVSPVVLGFEEGQPGRRIGVAEWQFQILDKQKLRTRSSIKDENLVLPVAILRNEVTA